jgi:hypothetical protein
MLIELVISSGSLPQHLALVSSRLPRRETRAELAAPPPRPQSPRQNDPQPRDDTQHGVSFGPALFVSPVNHDLRTPFANAKQTSVVFSRGTTCRAQSKAVGDWQRGLARTVLPGQDSRRRGTPANRRTRTEPATPAKRHGIRSSSVPWSPNRAISLNFIQLRWSNAAWSRFTTSRKISGRFPARSNKYPSNGDDAGSPRRITSTMRPRYRRP